MEITAAAAWRAAGLAIIVSLIAAPAFSQTQAQPAAPTAQAQTAEGGVEEIVVTAEKTKQRLIDVPATVSAITGSQIDAQHMEQIKDLTANVANSDVKETFPGVLPVVTIRGVGLNDTSITDSPSAGIYVDGVSLVSLAEMNLDFFDLDRVEVLKGPQGTLYGVNSTAGAVNIISAVPTHTFSAYGKLGYGNYDTWTAEGMVNEPVSDQLSIRLSAKRISQQTGFYHDTVLADGTPGSRDLGQRDVNMGRAQIDFTPSEDWDFLTKVGFLNSRGQCCIGTGEGRGAVPAFVVPPFGLPSQNTQHGDPFSVDITGDPNLKYNQYDLTETINGDLGFAKLTSVTGYINFRRLYQFNGSGTNTNAYFVAPDYDKVSQVSEELRLADATPLVDWVAGIYAGENFVDINLTSTIGPDLFGTPPIFSQSIGGQMTRDVAGFGHATWHLTPELDFETGLRFGYERKVFGGGTIWTSVLPPPVLAAFGISTALTNGDLHLNENATDYKVQLDWKPMPDTLVYLGVAHGTKTGGFFADTAVSASSLVPYKPETLLSYEIGAKTQQHWYAVDTSFFYYDYKDIQSIIVPPPPNISQRIGNIPSAVVYGLDLSGSVKPVDGLTVQATLGYLNSGYSSFFNGGVIPAGNRLPNAPRTSYNLSILYQGHLSEDLDWSGQFSDHYEGDMFRNASNSPLIHTNPVTDLSANLTVIAENEGVEFSLWGKNLTDETHVLFGELTSLGVDPVFYSPPRTFGFTVTKRFE